jgi:hypothetical protein
MWRRSGRFLSPHYELPCRGVQPDITEGQAVAIGMMRDLVIDFLSPAQARPL